jgi:hypothetical protein
MKTFDHKMIVKVDTTEASFPIGEITGQQILEKYVNAYFAERLNLYLQHPRLRQAFFDIDNNKVGSTHESL